MLQGLTHPHLYDQGQLYSVAQVRFRTHSPKCCRRWEAEPASSPTLMLWKLLSHLHRWQGRDKEWGHLFLIHASTWKKSSGAGSPMLTPLRACSPMPTTESALLCYPCEVQSLVSLNNICLRQYILLYFTIAWIWQYRPGLLMLGSYSSASVSISFSVQLVLRFYVWSATCDMNINPFLIIL